jgi:uncharacterized membrane protein YraQ (UPF0718 family)
LTGDPVKVAGSVTTWLPTFQIIFLSLFLQGLPFLLAGSLLGACIGALVPVRALTGRLPRSTTGGILLGTVAGLLVPSCECVGAPLVRRLLRNGLSPAVAIAYLLASPALNPVCLISTWIAFQYDHPWLMVGTRAGGAVFIAVTVALVFSRRPVTRLLRAELVAAPLTEPGWWENPPANWLARRYPLTASCLATGLADFLNVAFYYLSGCLLAAGVQTALPPYAPPDLHPGLLIPGFMGLSVVASLCSSADAFVARSFAGYPLAALFAFLWLGAVLDLKLLFMYRTIFTRGTVLTLAGWLVALVLAMSLVAAWLPLERWFYGIIGG